jgi:hypothetical protein
MTDEPLTTCPECGSQIRRVLFPAGVVFKGSGFYKTDYNKNGAVIGGTNGDGKKAESIDGDGSSSHGDNKTGESKTPSEAGKASADTGNAGSTSSTANGTHNSHNADKSASKSATPATTK